jgi:hypothetical protein
MRNWRKILSWEETVEEPHLPQSRPEAIDLAHKLHELKRHGDASVHFYNVYWSGFIGGSSVIEARNIEEAKVLLDYGMDEGFESDDPSDWESRSISCSETGEEEDW